MADKRVEVLLVEDNPNDVMLAVYTLKKYNLSDKIHVVRDGAEALEFLFCTGAYAGRRHENPWMILLDKNLPLVDGMEVLRQIRSDPRTCLVPVVMFTTSAEESDLIDSFNLRVNSYVVKPMGFEQFTDTARKLGHFWLLVNEPPPEQRGKAFLN